MENKKLVFVLLWLCSTSITAIFCVATFKLPKLYRLIEYGVRAQATVTEKLPDNHQGILYSFEVDGRKYSRGDVSLYLDKDFEQISIGDVVPVTYEKDNPENSILGNPEPVFYSYAKFSVFISFFPTIALIIFALKYFNLPEDTKSN